MRAEWIHRLLPGMVLAVASPLLGALCVLIDCRLDSARTTCGVASWLLSIACAGSLWRRPHSFRLQVLSIACLAVGIALECRLFVQFLNALAANNRGLNAVAYAFFGPG